MTIQRRSIGRDGPFTAPPIVHEVLRSPGEPLDAASRAYFEPRFGHDFSRVRVHADAKAAESARAVNALAYTFGRDIVLADRRSGTSASSRGLLAHELTHVLQQPNAGNAGAAVQVGETDSAAEKEADRVASAIVADHEGIPAVHSETPSIQRQVNPGEIAPTPCDKAHSDAIQDAENKAAGWVGKAVKWIEDHRDHIKKRTKMGTGFRSAGPQIFSELQILERNFRISDVMRGMHTSFPSSADADYNDETFNNWGKADFDILQKLNSVKIGALNFNCQQTSPKGQQGAEIVGFAVPGSSNFTICTKSFDQQSDPTKTGVVLHEAFHASFSEFNHDTYSFASDYPGPQPRTNAESFASFSAVAATGSDYHVQVVSETTITGSPGGQTPSPGGQQPNVVQDTAGGPVTQGAPDPQGGPKQAAPNTPAISVHDIEISTAGKPDTISKFDPQHPDQLAATLTGPFVVHAEGKASAGDCSGISLGWVQLCRPFYLRRAIYKSKSGGDDIEIDPSSNIRAAMPVVDVHNPGDIFLNRGNVTCSDAGADKPATATLIDTPSAGFGLATDQDHFLAGIAWQSFHFNTLTLIKAGQPPQHLKSFFWDMQHCEEFGPPSGGGKPPSLKKTGGVSVGNFIDGAPNEPGLALMGLPANKTCLTEVTAGANAGQSHQNRGKFTIGC
jgi:hypothetical protein